MKERLETIKFLDVTTSMLPNGIPFPALPESPEIMNIIIPDMLQNALTGSMTVDEAADDAAAEGQGPDGRPLVRPQTHDPAGGANAPPAPFASAGARHSDHGDRPRPSAPRKSDLARSGIAPARLATIAPTTLYVLPAIVVMLIVIAYPVYYTIDLSFFRTPPSLQLKDKIFVGLDNYDGHPHQRRVLDGHLEHGGLDDRARPSSPSCSASPPRSRCTANSSAAACCARSCSFPG